MWSSSPIGWKPQKRLNNATMFLSVFGEQPLFHRVEGSDVFRLPARGLLADKAHHLEGEAFAGHVVLDAPYQSVRKFFNKFNGRKIALVEIIGTFEVAYRLQHIHSGQNWLE